MKKLCGDCSYAVEWRGEDCERRTDEDGTVLFSCHFDPPKWHEIDGAVWPIVRADDFGCRYYSEVAS